MRKYPLPNHLFFNIPSYLIDDSGYRKPIIENYDYLFPILENFFKKSNRIEIHCWNHEIETIEEIKAFSEEGISILRNENITIFKGNITASISDYLLKNYLNKAGEFKWFTVNLDQSEESVFHSGHWATEFYVPNINEEDHELIRSVTPVDTDFLQISS